MTLSAEAEQNRPKKPLTAYFRFRGEKLAEFKDKDDKNQLAKDAWDNIDPKMKEEYDN